MQRIIKYVVFTLILVNILYVLSGVLFHPLQSIDAIGIWLLKAKAMYLEQGFPSSLLHNPEFFYSHPRYPLTIPSLFYFLYLLLGGIREHVVVLVYPVLYCIILYIVYKTIRFRATIVFSLLGTYIYSSLPPLIAQGGRVLAGNADIFLVLIEWIIIYILYRSKKVSFILITLLIMIASIVKLEGVFFLAFIIFFPVSRTQKLTYILLGSIPIVLWMSVMYWIHIPSDNQLSFYLPSLLEIPQRTMIVFLHVVKELINIHNWYLFWPLLFGVLFINYPLSKPLKQVLLPGVCCIFLCFIAVYFFTRNNLPELMSASLDRLLLQHSPVIFMVFVEKLGALKYLKISTLLLSQLHSVIWESNGPQPLPQKKFRQPL